MDYSQFRKFMEKVGEIEKLMEKVGNMEGFLQRICENLETSLEEIKGAILSIDSVVQMYIEGKITMMMPIYKVALHSLFKFRSKR